MGVFDSELTLPGVITEILPITINTGAGSQFGTTESVTIIGTAFNGPVGEPVPIGTPEQAIYYFGDSFDPATKREATLVPEIVIAVFTEPVAFTAVFLEVFDVFLFDTTTTFLGSTYKLATASSISAAPGARYETIFHYNKD